METTNKINASAILNAFNNYNKSFNAAIRYIFDMAKEAETKTPASPAKDDKSEEAKALRKEIKAVEAKNAIIADCKKIVAEFAITANDIKGKGINALYSKVTARIPNVDENGKAVKFAKLPSYLKSEIKDYATIMQVVPASWIESICAATDNTECKRNEYVLTCAPIIEEGVLTIPTSGDIVNTKGEKIETAKIFATWEKEAKINNISNAAGREKAKETKAELKATK